MKEITKIKRQIKAEHKKERTLTSLYFRYLQRYVRLQKLKRLNAPPVIIGQEKQMLRQTEQDIKDHIRLLTQYEFALNKKHEKDKKDLNWRDYIDAETKLLYSIFYRGRSRKEQRKLKILE